MDINNIWHKACKRLHRLIYQPIRVYCLHHVCTSYDAGTMYEGDWIALDEFKQKILAMQQAGVQFISLLEAHRLLKATSTPYTLHSTLFRFRKYAVLTFDDGYASLKEVLPWLKEHDIPVMLFINPDYAAGKAYRESDKEKYLTIEELAELDVEIGMHGLQHLDVTKMNEDEFYEFAESSFHHSINSSLKHFIPFWAYTWGRHNSMTDRVLKEKGITPVYIDGMKNYNDASCIHRELLDNYK